MLVKLLVFAALAVSTVSAAQQAHTPPLGSPLRKAIMETLRKPVQKDFKGQKVVFKVEFFKVMGEWAFLWGEPTVPNGKPLKTKGTKFQAAADAGAYDPNISALLKKNKGKWKVLRYVVGATDVPWIGWQEEFHAPKSIFPQP